MTDLSALRQILSPWALEPEALLTDIPIAGSPERTALRMVLSDTRGARWLLEKIPHGRKRSKLDIIGLLRHLAGGGFTAALPYRPTQGGGYHSEGEDGLWQLRPFVESPPLDRPGYLFDAWRGREAASLLISLRQGAAGFPVPGSRDFFSITEYITDMAEKIRRHNPEVMKPLAPVIAYLEGSFFGVHHALPSALCHGDFHPLNIIWKQDGIAALIDWEFFGLKPEAYDVANMLGCLGMEEPRGLSEGMAPQFIAELKQAAFLSPESQASLLDLTLALRFAWLSEWLRNRDTNMVELELTYMYLLMDNREKILASWEL